MILCMSYYYKLHWYSAEAKFLSFPPTMGFRAALENYCDTPGNTFCVFFSAALKSSNIMAQIEWVLNKIWQCWWCCLVSTGFPPLLPFYLSEKAIATLWVYLISTQRLTNCRWLDLPLVIRTPFHIVRIDFIEPLFVSFSCLHLVICILA